MATYTFEVDVDGETWRCLNDQDVEIASGATPLTTEKRINAIFADNGVSGPTADAVRAYLSKDWDDIGV